METFLSDEVIQELKIKLKNLKSKTKQPNKLLRMLNV